MIRSLAGASTLGLLLGEPVHAQGLLGRYADIGESLPCALGSASCMPRDPYHDNCSDPWLKIVAVTEALRAFGMPLPLEMTISVAWGHNNFQSACRRHDHCYHHGYCSYGKTKARCDLDFWNDMRAKCNDLGIFRVGELLFCRQATDLFFLGVDWSDEAARAYLGPNGYYSCYEGTAGCQPRPTAAFLDPWW